VTIKKVKTKSGAIKWEVSGRLGGRGSPQIRQRFDRKEDAERFRTSLLRDKQSGGIVSFSRTTLDQYAATWWERWQRDKAPNSIRNYRGALKRYVLPRLGPIRISGLTPPRAAQFRDELLAEGKGEATVRYAMAVLSAICADAVEKGELQANPVRAIKKPSAPIQREGVALSAREVELLRDEMPTDRDALVVSSMAYGGLRPEEALALTWPDVRERVLNVDKAVTHGQPKTTKNEQRRAVDMLGPLADDFESYRKQLKTIPGPGAWVFPHPNDPARPWSDSMYRNWRQRVFAPAAARVGLSDLVPYDLRRTFVSLLLSCGYRRGEVSDQAGHSLAVMEKHYAVTIAEYRGVPMTDAAEVIREARAARVLQRREAAENVKTGKALEY
jgi:integrase